MTRCPSCGRRHRPRRATAPDPRQEDLFAWQAPKPRPVPRLLLLHYLPDAEGQPMPALLFPGDRRPRPFRSLAAARAALARMEARA